MGSVRLCSAGLCALAAGCYGASHEEMTDKSEPAYAPRPDEPPDATEPDLVRVAVTDEQGMPLGDAQVLFHDWAGALVAHQTTDGTGTAAASVPAGGSITVAMLAPEGGFELVTVLGVEPGDEVLIDAALASDGDMGTSLVTVAAPPAPGSTHLGNGCGEAYFWGPRTDLPLAFGAPCMTAASTVDYFAIAFSGRPIAYLSQQVLVDPAWPSVWLGPWQESFVEVEVSNSGLSTGDAATARLFTVTDKARFALDEVPVPAWRTLYVPAQLPGELELAWSVTDLNGNGESLERVRLAQAPRSIMLDGATLLPRPTGLYWDGALRFAAPATIADAVRARFDWPEHRWTVLAPPDARAIDLPELPAALWLWHPPDDQPQYAEVALLDLGSLPDYDAARTRPLDAARRAEDDSRAESEVRVSRAWLSQSSW